MSNNYVPTFWNTTTKFNGSTRTSKVSGGSVAYKKRGTAWDLINNDIQNDFSVTSFPGNVQIPANAQGWMDICFDSQYSAKRQITEGDWVNSEDEFEMRMRADCPTNATGIIHPDKPWQVVYYNAFGQGSNLIYGIWRGRASRVEHVIEITEMPPGDSEFLTYDFYIESNDATTFIGADFDQRPWDGNSGDAATVEGFDIFLAKGSDSSTIRGSVLKTPVCWWANLDGTTTKKDVRIDFEIQPDGDTVKATKYIRRTDIAKALSQGVPYRADATFSPDANPETSSVDGQVQRNGQAAQTWANIISSAGTGQSDNGTVADLTAVATASSGFYNQMLYPITTFDTSSIGAGQSIDSASLTVRMTRALLSGDLNLTWNVYEHPVITDTSLSFSDYMNHVTTPLSDTARDAEAESASATSIETTFNADGRAAVDPEGVTELALSYTQAVESGSPTWGSNYRTTLRIDTAESANDPLLTVTHSSASNGFLTQNNNAFYGDQQI